MRYTRPRLHSLTAATESTGNCGNGSSAAQHYYCQNGVGWTVDGCAAGTGDSWCTFGTGAAGSGGADYCTAGTSPTTTCATGWSPQY